MTALLTDNLPLLAVAPNGIKKLRELILELAVRGKLVPQDPNDEPASELLKRIAEEKSRLVNEGKKLKQQTEISEEEKPFSVPKHWSWIRLGGCLEMINGRAFKPTEWVAAGLPIVRIQNLNNPDAPFNYCNPETVDNRHVIDTGTILISWSGTPGTSFGAFIWERGKAALNQHIFSCFQIGNAFFDKFLKLAINTRLEELIAKAHGGVGLQHVTKGKLEALTLVLPPLAEQHRIVAKVDQLMALCDRLEAQQTDAESAHTQLVQSLLDSLTQASDATDFAANWQRLAEHFHTLFSTESSIDALKQTLLQLAVMGKLVPQDTNDEPASELLKRIAEEKSRLVAAGELKKQKSLPEITIEEEPYALPSNWKWVRFDSVSNTRLGKMLDKAKNKGELRPYLRNTNVQWFNFEVDDLKSMRFEEHELDEYRVIPGDLVICEGGEPGRCAVWQGEVEDMFIQKALHRARPWLGISPFFLQFCLKAAAHSGFLDQFFTGATIKHFSGEKLAKYPVPLPPLAEQHRIVAKVDQLMALCDQLKTRLTQARQLNEQLASTLVEQAVA